MNKIKCTPLLFAGLIWSLSAFSQSDTSCTNLTLINSSSDEYLPFLVDSSLFFTSDRKNTLEGQTLEFTEKVYYSMKKEGKWGVSKKVGYKWNSDNNTALVGVSPKNFYFYRSYWRNNGEIFVASRKADTITSLKAEHLEKVKAICSDFDENSVSTCKEDTFYFVSDRGGNYDIYIQAGSNAPITVDVFNTQFNEHDVFLTKHGRSLYFSSDRPGGKGGFDVYQSNKMNGHWSDPVHVQSKYVNTEADDRDFHWYNDSTMFLSSNRSGGVGGFDIYQINLKKIPILDTIKQMRVELVQQLEKLDLMPFKGELQLGAYRYIKSVAAFKKTFKCIEDEDLRIDTLRVEGTIVYKYIINKVYTDVDEALTKQYEIIKRNCLPDKDFQDMPFIGILDQKGSRYAIFWKKDEFENQKVFNIYSEGKMVWKGRRF